MSYLLIHRSPSGKVAAHGGLFEEAEEAARASALYISGDLGEATEFAVDFASKLTGCVAEHPSGCAFRVLKADVTLDGSPITPDLKVYVNGWWGTVQAEQFMATDLLSPGSRFHDGWYLVYKENKPYAKFNGERMAVTESVE